MGKAPRSAGFHHFIASAEVKAKLPGLLREREESRKRDAKVKGIKYVKEEEFNAHHAIKSKLWSEQSEEIQNAWKTIAEASKEKYHLSLDKCGFLLSVEFLLRYSADPKHYTLHSKLPLGCFLPFFSLLTICLFYFWLVTTMKEKQELPGKCTQNYQGSLKSKSMVFKVPVLILNLPR